jgi:putative tryptophan/tyrosine transport system substrate-binding protein
MSNLIKFILISLGFINATLAHDQTLITVNQFVNHIALDAAYDGLIHALEERKVLPDKAELIVSNAQGNIANSVQISKYHASFSPDFMVAIATPSAQTNLKAKIKDTKLAFVAVTDPEAANLVGAQNVIGVSDNPPVAELVELVRKIFPDLRSVGVISNPGEINSVKMSEMLEKILSGFDIKVKKASIANSSDIKTAMNKLIGSVDLIYLPQDNSVISALDSIISISKMGKTPLIANDPTLVKRGVMVALGSNYFKSGEQLGNMIADLIEGKNLKEDIQNTKIRELRINREVAKEFAIKIPDNLGEIK